MTDRRFEHGKPVLRRGRTKSTQTYLVQKQRGTRDFAHQAPPGSIAEWCGQTNEGHEDGYGGARLLWVYLPEFIDQVIGLEEHEVEWEAADV